MNFYIWERMCRSCLSLFIWLNVISSCIHFVAYGRLLFFFYIWIIFHHVFVYPCIRCWTPGMWGQIWLSWTVQVSLWYRVPLSFGVELLDSVVSLFLVLRNLHIAFHNSCTNLHSHQHREFCNFVHQQSTEVPSSPHPHQHVFLIWVLAILTGLRG